MFDASAYELADLADPVSTACAPAPADVGDSEPSSINLTVPASLTLAACATCQQAFGDCAVQAARAGAISPALALAICSSMQRMAERAFNAPVTGMGSYFAYVLLGNPRGEEARRREFESLAETMR